MVNTTKLELGLIGLATCTVPLVLESIATDYENQTRELKRDEVVEQLRTAAKNVEKLNQALLRAVKEIP